MSLPTSSAIDRAMHCVASAALPGVDVTTPQSETGTATHDFAKRVRQRAELLTVGDITYEEAVAAVCKAELEAIPAGAKHLDHCLAVDFDAIPRGAQSELTLAWNWRTGAGRVLGQDLERDYSAAGPDELVGTADLAGVRGNTVIIRDYKTGLMKVSAERSWQLRSLAVYAAAAVKATAAEVEMIYTLGDELFVDRARYEELDLADDAVELRALVERILPASAAVVATGRAPEGSIHAGPWCEYCRAIPFCPEQTNLARSMLQDLTEAAFHVEVTQAGPLSPVDAGRAWVLVERVEDLLPRVKKGLSEMARARPFPTPDGRIVRAEVKEKEYVIPSVAQTVLQREYSAELAAACVPVQPDTSKAQIKRAFVAAGKKAKDATAAVERIAAAGGVEVRTYSTVRAVENKNAAKVAAPVSPPSSVCTSLPTSAG